MSCIKVNIGLLDLITQSAIISLWSRSPTLKVLDTTYHSTIKVRNVEKKMRVKCGLVCTLNTIKHLNIEPDVLWLMPENNFYGDVVVYSNVEWKVS